MNLNPPLEDAERERLARAQAEICNTDFTEKIVTFDKWQEPYLEAIEGLDPKRMAEASAVKAQAVVTDVMTNVENPPQVRLAAAQYTLGQAGFGEVKKIEQVVKFNTMDMSQLIPILRSKLAAIQKADPSFDPKALLPAGVLEGEFSDSAPAPSDPPSFDDEPEAA